VGQIVKAQVLAIDTEKRQIKLSMKQLVPTDIDEYIAEHKIGDAVSGRVVEVAPEFALVELGEGIRSASRSRRSRPPQNLPGRQSSSEAKSAGPLDLLRGFPRN